MFYSWLVILHECKVVQLIGVMVCMLMTLTTLHSTSSKSIKSVSYFLGNSWWFWNATSRMNQWWRPSNLPLRPSNHSITFSSSLSARDSSLHRSLDICVKVDKQSDSKYLYKNIKNRVITTTMTMITTLTTRLNCFYSYKQLQNNDLSAFFRRLNDNGGKQEFEILFCQLFESINNLMKDGRSVKLVVCDYLINILPSLIPHVLLVYNPIDFR